jgi:DNA polymerase-3 subunit epsilon
MIERLEERSGLKELPRMWPDGWPRVWPFQRREQAKYENLPGYVQKYLEAARPDVHQAWRAVPYSVLDIETTGFSHRRDSMLSIGLIDIEDGRIQLDRSWYSLLQPPDGVEIPAESIRVHGLLRGDVAQARPAEEVLPELLNRLGGRVLVVHYAAIDIKFLSHALKRLWGVDLRGPAIDTMLIAQTLYQRQRRLGGDDSMNMVTALSPLAEQAGIPSHGQHNALGDALTTAQLFLAQASKMEQQGSGSLQKLLKAGRCLR